MSKELYAQVIVDISHSQVDKVFQYVFLPEHESCICAGSRVLVPFGRGNHPIEGFVLAIDEVCLYDRAKLKTVIRPLEDYNALQSDQLALAYFMQNKYDCNLVDALRLMIPAKLRGQRVHEKKVRVVSLAPDVDMARALQELKRAPKQQEILQFLQGVQGSICVADLSTQIPNAASVLNTLEQKGFVQQFYPKVYRRPYESMSDQIRIEHTPTPAQQRIIQQLCDAIGKEGGNFLLRGITGSGKTEIYLRAIAYALKLGKQAIMLVPEISLTPQTVERFRNRFGACVAVLHSRLSDGERFDEWSRIRLGEVGVVVGARSAIFAPFENLGLVVIDEEHESSYRSDKHPRYDSIDIAKKRMELMQGTLLLASATPCIETYYEAKSGGYTLLELAERINGLPLPRVNIVDMRTELAQGNRSIFSVPLYREIKKCYQNKEQLLLFINRRGFATFVGCRGCGEPLMCPHCSVSLTYHRSNEKLMCHYCNYSQDVPEVCPICAKKMLKQFGMGTQQVEEQLQKYFPMMKILRMDYDTTQTKDAHLEILGAFSRGEAQALIGTQMIAKGLDFPQVTLVGAIAADAALHVPDFRSAERAFSLLTQVAGRAGRERAAGRVIVQTYSPDHPSILFAGTHDYSGFYAYEIEERRKNLFAPFADFVRFVFSGDDPVTLEEQCIGFCQALEEQLHKLIAQQQYDPNALCYIANSPAPIHQMKNLYRHQVILKIKRDAQGGQLLRAVSKYASDQKKAGCVFSFELNPQNMM